MFVELAFCLGDVFLETLGDKVAVNVGGIEGGGVDGEGGFEVGEVLGGEAEAGFSCRFGVGRGRV